MFVFSVFQMPKLKVVCIVCIVFVIIIELSESKNRCHSDNCTCTETHVNCQNFVPENVTASVREITISKLDPIQLYAGRLCRVNWPNVTILNIYSDDSDFEKLGDGVFDCLSRVTTLKLRSSFLRSFSKWAFAGLTSLLELDLSFCGKLGHDFIYTMLYERNNFPNLRRLNISAISVGEFLAFNTTFMKVFCNRTIEFLDISQTYSYLDFTKDTCFCETLTTLVTKNSLMLFHPDLGPCKSLQLLDQRSEKAALNGLILKGFRCAGTKIIFRLGSFLGSATIYYSPTLLAATHDVVLFSNCTFILYENSSIIELHMTHNDFRNFDIMLVNPIIEYIDLSQNNIETLNPNALLHLASLEKVDFSYNKLYRMRFEHTWADLFKHKLNLTDINLSYNQLEHLPLNTFSSNLNLKYIRLGGNKFHQITFDITKLVNLQLLNLQLNRIEFFETGSIGFLDSLLDSQQRSGTNTNISDILHVVLQGNPLTCACVAKDFLRWMIDSPTFPNQQLHVLSCKATDSKMQITYAAVEEATNDCARPQRMRVTISLSSALSTHSSGFGRV